MRLKVVGWLGFIFLGAGILILSFGPTEWRSIGCGALLTAVTVYGVGFFLVVRQIAMVRRRVNVMLQQAAEEMERRTTGF